MVIKKKLKNIFTFFKTPPSGQSVPGHGSNDPDIKNHLHV